MSVTDYVLLGRSAHHSYLGAETARDRRVAAAVIERLALGEFAGRRLGELSGGEAQRAVMARALVQEAPVLVLDEPTTSLDLGHSQLVLELADELRQEKGISVVCAMHDLTLAAQFAEDLLVLSHGPRRGLGRPGRGPDRSQHQELFRRRGRGTGQPQRAGGDTGPAPGRAARGRRPKSPT